MVNNCLMETVPELSEVHRAIAHLQQLVDLFQRRRAQLAAEVGLTDHQWGVLEEISSEHFMPSLFARQRESSAAAVSKTIRQLVNKGLVAVSVAVEDARQRRYELTADGQRVMGKLRERRQDAIARVWMKQDANALAAFNALAAGLSNELEALVNESGPVEAAPQRTHKE
jgi:DNA-binding MarR family transcriptional regulator